MTRMKVTLLIGMVFVMLGCGPKAGMQGETPGQVVTNEFVEPDMEETDGIQGYEDVVLTAEDERLVVPGTGMGRVPAMKKKGKKSNLKDPAYWPYGDGIPDLMEELVWGMSVKKVFSVFEHKIREKHEERMKAEQGDLLAEDRIRSEMIRELNKVKNSYVAFNGQTTGYESHMVNPEFTHNNNESMLVWDAGKYVEYLFFIKDRFWKRVRLFRIDELGGITLGDFLATMEPLMGRPGQEIVDDEGELEMIVWRDEDTFAAILDGSEFFGVYGLRLSAAQTEVNLAKIRVNADKTDPTKVSADVASTIDRAVSSVDMDDHQESVIDSYTGKSHTDGPFGSTDEKSGQAAPKQEKPTGDKNLDGDVDSLF